MSALIQAYENKIADLERALAEANNWIAFAQDQLDVALKDRDHAEREKDMLVAHADALEHELKEARGQLGAEHAAHLATGRWLADVEQQLARGGGPGHDEK